MSGLFFNYRMEVDDLLEKKFQGGVGFQPDLIQNGFSLPFQFRIHSAFHDSSQSAKAAKWDLGSTRLVPVFHLDFGLKNQGRGVRLETVSRAFSSSLRCAGVRLPWSAAL